MPPPSPFSISLRSDDSTDYGYLVHPGEPLHELLTMITERVVGIMRTDIVQDGLNEITEEWAQHWRLQLGGTQCDELIAGFDYLLRRAITSHAKWPLLIIDWTMDERNDAAIITVPDAMRSEDTHYALEHNRIHLNGLVSFHPSQHLLPF